MDMTERIAEAIREAAQKNQTDSTAVAKHIVERVFSPRSDVEYMDLTEFRNFGYLQEINRRFLHPLGIALEVDMTDDDQVMMISGVWDCRDDPEGINYGDDVLDIEKARRVKTEEEQRRSARYVGLGYVIQPLGYV